MKPLPLLLTALLAFAAAWLLKPAPQPIVITEKSAPPKRQPIPELAISEPAAPSDSPPRKFPASPFASQADSTKTAQSRDDAKLLRLTEALNLNADQQAALLQIIAAAQAAENPDNQPLDPSRQLELAATTGGNIEKSLDALFTPEQAAAFAALRQRALENTVENAAQSQLSTFAGKIDLTPAQREKALASLRAAAASKLAARPAALALVLDDSVLPTGPAAISATSIESLQQFDLTQNGPAAARRPFGEIQRQNLDAQLDLYRPILTSAQLSQLKVTLDERKQTLDRVAEIIR